MIELIKKLPFDVIINNILPYTYQVKPKLHLIDIRSFYDDYNFLSSMFYEYNEIIILNDIIRYCNDNIAPIYDMHPRYENILKRHVLFANKTKINTKNFIFADFHRRILHAPEVKIKFIFGLMKPRERTDFFNKYYIEDE